MVIYFKLLIAIPNNLKYINITTFDYEYQCSSLLRFHSMIQQGKYLAHVDVESAKPPVCYLQIGGFALSLTIICCFDIASDSQSSYLFMEINKNLWESTGEHLMSFSLKPYYQETVNNFMNKTTLKSLKNKAIFIYFQQVLKQMNISDIKHFITKTCQQFWQLSDAINRA